MKSERAKKNFKKLIFEIQMVELCCRFIVNSRSKPVKRNLGDLSVEKLYLSQLKLVKHIQEFLVRELYNINNGCVDKNKAFTIINLFVDRYRILRVGG